MDDTGQQDIDRLEEQVDRVLMPATRYEVYWVTHPVVVTVDRMGPFLASLRDAVVRGGRVVQWLQSSVAGDPASGGMVTQLTAIVEFDK